uniref:tensin-4-like n=1 Tax=Pristiophorus japonicus TaxID=55135 RepID=UPI00398EF964
MKDGGFFSEVMSSHSAHMERGPGRCAAPRMETIVLNGSSANRGQSRAICPGPVSASRTDSYSHCPSERWVCREVKMSPPNPSCHSQGRGQPGLGRSHTVLVKSVSSQKPPIHDGVRRTATARVITHHGPGGPQDTARASDQYWGNTPTSTPSCMDDEPLSPSLDATIENLNNLILELDPTFQPITTCTKPSYLNNTHLDRHSEEPPLDGHSPGILIYDEWDSGRIRNTELNGSTSVSGRHQSESPEWRVQNTAPSSSTPHCTMPSIPGYNMLDAAQTDSAFRHASPSLSICSTPQFCASSPDSVAGQPAHYWKGAARQPSGQTQENLCSASVSTRSSSPQPGSQPIPVPAPCSYSASSTGVLPPAAQQHGTSPAHPGIPRELATCYLSTSAGSGNLLSAGASGHTRLTDSSTSLLSTSPVWDTLGSCQSLSDDGEAGRIYRSVGSTYGSSGSFVNLQSPFLVSPCTYKNSYSDQQLHQACGQPEGYQTLPHSRRAAHSTSRQAGPGTTGRRAVVVPPGKTTAQIQEHSSSCPPSAASSYSDIPLLLVNGTIQYLDQDSHRPKNKRLQSSSSSTLSLPVSGLSMASSTTSLEDLPCDAQPTVKFVQDTTKYWYKPNISRDQAIEMLKDKEPGSFIIRESTTYIGSFGLAMKAPSSSLANPETRTDSPTELVRHFLIEFSPKGVCLKGCPQEPYFGSLSALVYQHCISARSLPCKLHLPKPGCLNDKKDEGSRDSTDSVGSPVRKRDAACYVLYLSSVTMESLTGPQAVLKAASFTLEQEPLPEAAIVQFKVSEQGITLTDSKRRLFFRRHYPAGSVNHCGLDPLQRKWRKDNEPSRIFAFVAKKQGSASENVCHLFAEFEQDHSAHLIINHVSKTLLEPQRM